LGRLGPSWRVLRGSKSVVEGDFGPSRQLGAHLTSFGGHLGPIRDDLGGHFEVNLGPCSSLPFILRLPVCPRSQIKKKCAMVPTPQGVLDFTFAELEKSVRDGAHAARRPRSFRIRAVHFHVLLLTVSLHPRSRTQPPTTSARLSWSSSSQLGASNSVFEQPTRRVEYNACTPIIEHVQPNRRIESYLHDVEQRTRAANAAHRVLRSWPTACGSTTRLQPSRVFEQPTRRCENSNNDTIPALSSQLGASILAFKQPTRRIELCIRAANSARRIQRTRVTHICG
jgi:hypothetical protein